MAADLERLTGIEVRRIHVNKGHRGHNHPNRFRVWISGQMQRVTKAIRREMKRRASVEPVIGHVKAEHRMGRNYLRGRAGDRINAVLAAGYNLYGAVAVKRHEIPVFFSCLSRGGSGLSTGRRRSTHASQAAAACG